MITLTKSGNAIVFTFDDNDHYLNDGKIEVPVNSLTLVTDESQMATFKKSATNDIFISARYDELGMSKSDLETWFKENACGSTGGGGGVTSGEVQTMIDESISGKADTSAVTEEISEAVSGKADTSAVTQSINAAVSGKADTSDVQTLSGQVETDEKVTATALVDLDNRKLDASAYTPTDLSNYYTKSETNTQINNATDGLLDASTFNTYSANTNARLAEDEEVTSAALNELNEALSGKADTTAVTASIAAAVSGKQDTLIAGTNIKTINNESLLGSGNIDIQGGGKAIEAGRGIAITTGATADTVSFDLPISAGTGSNSLVMGDKVIASGAWSFSNGNGTSWKANTASGERSIAIGYCCESNSNTSIAIGQYCNVSNNAIYAKALGSYIDALNLYETSLGNCNISNKNNTNSGNTLFSIGNGQDLRHRHNAFEIRHNGDIYIADTNDTTYQNYYEKPMIKLQDALGGVPESAFTAYTASTEARLAEDEEVTAAALNTLNDALDDKADASDLGGLKLVSLTQAQYDALATKDASTLYIITSSN